MLGWGGSDSNTSSSSQESKYGTTTPTISPQYAGLMNTYAKSLGLSDLFPSSGATNSGGSTATNIPGAGSITVPNYAAEASGQSAATGPAPGSPTGPGIPGANAQQTAAMNWNYNNLVNGPVDPATTKVNNVLMNFDGQYSNLGDRFGDFTKGAPRQADYYLSDINPLRTATTAGAAASAGTTQVNAQTAASAAAPYSQLYGSAVTDPALKAFDYGTDRAFSALDARTAGAGAFGNSRSGLGYSDLGTQAALQRGQLSAGLNTQGLTSAFGFGAGDASRDLTAQTTNASNTLNTNEFNAGLQQQANIWNAGAQNDMAKSYVAESGRNADRGTQGNQFNVNAGYQGDQQKIQALGQQASILQQRSGLSQQILQNIVTANGIDSNAAQTMFMQGAITESQLSDILKAASATNGSSFTQNTSAQGDSNTFTASAGASIG